MIVRNLTLPMINQQLVRGPIILVPGYAARKGIQGRSALSRSSAAPKHVAVLTELYVSV